MGRYLETTVVRHHPVVCSSTVYVISNAVAVDELSPTGVHRVGLA